MEETIGRDNLAYRQPRRHPDEFELTHTASPDSAQIPDHVDPGGHFKTLDKTNGGSDNFYPDVVINSQSEV